MRRMRRAAIAALCLASCLSCLAALSGCGGDSVDGSPATGPLAGRGRGPLPTATWGSVRWGVDSWTRGETP